MASQITSATAHPSSTPTSPSPPPGTLPLPERQTAPQFAPDCYSLPRAKSAGPAFLLTNSGPMGPQPANLGAYEKTTQPCRYGHPSETTDTPRDYADHRNIVAQRNYGRM